MGFFSRLLVPRSVRRAVHPVRTLKSAATPRVVKRARRVANPVDTALYEFERGLNTNPRRRSNAPVYMHGNCPVKHRSTQAAARCRNR
jgi:DNA-directed RNA polymerase subunit K/omega